MWWDLLAQLVNDCVRYKVPLPQAWTKTWVVLVNKSDGGVRPINTASQDWRTIGAVMLSRCNAWLADVLPAGIASAEQEGERICVASIDLSNRFDNIDPYQALQIASHMGMPDEIYNLLESFYMRVEVCFRASGKRRTRMDQKVERPAPKVCAQRYAFSGYHGCMVPRY